MCIILDYVLEENRGERVRKTRNFINDKKENSFLLCFYVKDENIPKWIERQKILLREFVKQTDKDYDPYSSEESRKLTPRDKKKISKLNRSPENREEIIRRTINTTNEIERGINSFIESKIDEFVTPVSEIDPDLKGHLFTWLKSNDSDAKTIASAVQEHNRKELKILTADKKDWRKELLDEIHNDFELKKKYPKLPVIKYSQNLEETG